MRQTLWYSWRVRGYWLHVYRDVGERSGRRYLVVECDRNGRTWPVVSWGK